MKKITWSTEAEFDYAENIDYLLQEWSVQDAEEFIIKVENNKVKVYCFFCF